MTGIAAHERARRPLRALEIAAFVCLAALILWVYVAKAAGADERSAIRSLQGDIAEERAQIRLLRAEAAHLERPDRLEALAREHLHMEPADPQRETTIEALTALSPTRESGEAEP